MEKKDKQLLLEDLCARLPYGVKIQCWYGQIITSDINTFPYSREEMAQEDMEDQLEGIKPYLRSLTDMTKEEVEEYNQLWEDDGMKIFTLGKELAEEYKKKDYDSIWSHPVVPIYKHIDWLNAHHFDYRGLIEKGLAIKVTPENNPYK